ncbi:MAG: rhodanese-like domain-containing protein [Burkholderiaceae bacterium]
MTTALPQIRPNQLAHWRDALHADRPDAACVLLDVREPWEVQTASVHADGFQTVAIPMGELPNRLGELDPSQPVACLCHHGARSQRVALFLQHSGFADVANIAGGIDAWSRERDAAVPLY